MNKNAKKTKPFPSYLRIIDGETILIRTSKMAEIMNVTPKQLADWGKAGAPREEQGWWNLEKFLKWRGLTVGEHGGTNALADKLNADVKLKQLKAKNEELKFKELTGELVPVSLVYELVSKDYTEARIQFAGLGEKILSQIYTLYPELAIPCKRMIEIEVRKACDIMSETNVFNSCRKTSVHKKYKKRNT
jgi:hypothetical protein